MIKINLALATALLCCSLTTQSQAEATTRKDTSQPTTRVILSSDLDWQMLNPKRGDKSPRAATIWGDRNGSKATGFLVKFVDGFRSPPHIHNVTYRGVVISGLVHNDDPGAKNMWMPTGSYWTQPAGEVHVTAAKGGNNIALIEIDQGPYLVQPSEESFDKGERPINVDASNIVWLDASNTSWIAPAQKPSPPATQAQLTFLWGQPASGQRIGSLLRLPAGFDGSIHTESSTLRAVIIDGQSTLHQAGGKKTNVLTPGSSFHANGKIQHHISCDDKTPCLIYIQSHGPFKVIPK